MRIVRHATLVPVPWRNGGGVTREIARAERDGRLAWRLSLADVAADGPFSDFSGLVRILTVVEGEGLDLLTPTGPRAADPLRPLRFDGGLAVEGRLRNGPIRDLNLIFDPTACEGAVESLTGPTRRSADGALGWAVHALRGSCEVDGAGALDPGDTALGDGPVCVTLAAGASVLLITLAHARSETIALR